MATNLQVDQTKCPAPEIITSSKETPSRNEPSPSDHKPATTNLQSLISTLKLSFAYAKSYIQSVISALKLAFADARSYIQSTISDPKSELANEPTEPMPMPLDQQPRTLNLLWPRSSTQETLSRYLPSLSDIRLMLFGQQSRTSNLLPIEGSVSGSWVSTEDSLSIDSLSEDSLSIDSLSEDSLSKDSLSEDSLSEDSLSIDSLSEDSLSADYISEGYDSEDSYLDLGFF
ncbi:hypothetical protein FQN57_004379 [Myotisia sp. PD_48]|nr:hypothetical protein FQN57_004379 [Myotisia sp. PD_48]